MARAALSPVILGLTLLASGCAAIVRGNSQQVLFWTSPPGATVELGSRSCETPCTVKLERGSNHFITVSKAGYKDAAAQLDRKMNGAWLLVDVLLFFPFNLFFLGPDYDLEPAMVDLTLEPVAASTAAPLPVLDEAAD